MSPSAWLRREADRHHVAVLHHVVAALDPQQSLVPRAGVAALVDQRLPREDLGADEALLDVRVDLAGCSLGTRAALDRVCLGLLALARGEERNELKQLERCANHASQPRLP